MCAGHVAAMQAAAAAAEEARGAVEVDIRRDPMFWEAAVLTTASLPAAASAALLAPLEAAMANLPEASAAPQDGSQAYPSWQLALCTALAVVHHSAPEDLVQLIAPPVAACRLPTLLWSE